MPPSGSRRGRRRRPQGGFVLLEILIALVIFTTLVLAYARATDNALLAAADANSGRALKMLTSRKLAEIRAGPNDFIEGDEGGFEEEVAYGDENPFLDYHWEVEAQAMIAAGYADDDEVEFVFDRDRDGGAPTAPEGGKAPDPIRLHRLTLTVTWLPEGSDQADRMRVVTFVPSPPESGETAPGGEGR